MIGWYFERESDPLIWGHTSRVAYLSLLFSAFSLAAVPSDFMDLLATAAIIHEVESDPSRPRQKGEAASRTVTFLQGKGIAIPMNILEIVMQQDEAFDGSGMPKKLKGQKITLHARVMALVDGFDHFRLQHPGGTRRVRFERTRSLMQETSSRYDPDLWNLFWPFMETVEIFD
jgi:hypothetical protein